ncbi:hypothetical protein JCM10212_000889 [Sporobolomyces blumeae]
MPGPPSSIVIPASPLDAQILSASSLAWAPAGPLAPTHPSHASHRLNGHLGAPSSRLHSTAATEPHFMTQRQFEQWRGSHPGESRNLRPTAGSDNMDKAMLQGYRAPQHPASHVLQSIPPRAPSRSSRSNILSYTLHLATSSRLSSYSSSNGTRTLLHWAEMDARDDARRYEDVRIEPDWFETEAKTQGLWTLGVNLLQSSRREGALPPSVERRVVLAGLAEDLLVSPSGERAITKIDEESVHPSREVDDLVVLKPLTSPDTTTLYLSTSSTRSHHHGLGDAAGTDSSTPRDRSHSVAQSLIDLKFGNVPTEPKASPVSIDDKPLEPTRGDAVPGSSVFGDAANVPSSGPIASTSTSSELTATPHMDYRIVLSQSMRTRAKTIFATSPLPSLTYTFCRRHRVASCGVCQILVAETSERASDHAQHRRRNVPGAGLRSGLSIQGGSSAAAGGEGGPSKRPLVSLVPTFLKLSADLIGDLQERHRAGGRDPEQVEEEDLAKALFSPNSAASVASLASPAKEEADQRATSAKGKEPERSSLAAAATMHGTSAWFDLLTSLLVQACLEGYLVDGWTGTEGVETLFGVGCGVWEGRGWSTASRPVRVVPEAKKVKAEHVATGEDEDEDDEEEEDEEDEEEVRARELEKQKMELVEAAHALFGSRDVAQAEYERGMRDRIHEFLNVPRDKSLVQHLVQLSIKYPLSSFEDDMVDFLEAAVRLLGKPALAKFDPKSASASSPSLNGQAARTTSSSDPDPFALVQYFIPSSESPSSRPFTVGAGSSLSPHRAWEDGVGTSGKRRRVD